MKQLQIGDHYSQTFVVQPNQTAKYLRSGNLEVFATPAMIACMENTALKLISDTLEDGSDSVGTEINVKHLKASLVGETIVFEAKVTNIDGRKIFFDIIAHNNSEVCIGTANHVRFIINVQQFMSKLKG